MAKEKSGSKGKKNKGEKRKDKKRRDKSPKAKKRKDEAASEKAAASAPSAKASANDAPAPNVPAAKKGSGAGPFTLAIDIGGTGTKMLTVDGTGEPLNERHRELTPKPCTPEALLALLETMVPGQPEYERVSVGFPGVVKRGVVFTAPNLGTEAWAGTDLGGAIAKITGKPTRVANDAELQGYGVIAGEGVELVLTLGTGLGTGLYTDGRLVANLELGHHPLVAGKTYEQRVCNAELKKVGKKQWSVRVGEVIAQLAPIFNYDKLYLGGGNTKKLTIELPKDVEIFTNVEGLGGAVRLWNH